MDYHMRWCHVVTCCRVMCAYYAYVTIRRALGVACIGSRHFVNTVSGQHFSAENKQEATEFDSQHLPMHFRGVIWKIKSKSNFPVSFSLINAEMNLVGNYRTLRGLRTVNPEGLPSTKGHIELKSILTPTGILFALQGSVGLTSCVPKLSLKHLLTWNKNKQAWVTTFIAIRYPYAELGWRKLITIFILCHSLKIKFSGA